MMILDEDLTGQQFGELTVVKRIDRKTWECKCSCGKVTTAYVYRLKNGGKKSCGCLSKSSQHKAKTNGYVLHPLYGTAKEKYENFGSLRGIAESL